MGHTKSAKPSQPPLVVEQIKRKIRVRIGKTWRIGDRLPPINQLAREMGVGEKNTYRAVRALAVEGLLESRPRHGTFVANRPRPAQPVKRKRHVIHVPLGADLDGMIQRMGRAFIQEMQRRGRDVRLVDDLPRRRRELDLRNVDADAMVLFNPQWPRIVMDEPGPLFSLIDTSGRPRRDITRRYDLVGPDHEQGGMLAGEFMRQFDITDAAFVGVGDPATGVYAEVDAARLAGFEHGFDMQLPAERRFFVDSYSEQCGAVFARDYANLKSRPQAMFMATDDIAAGFIIGGAALGLQSRRDYLLVGFDGQSRVMSTLSGGITTVAVPAEAMGRQAAEFLDMRLEHPDLPPRSISLGCTIQRGKTSPKPEKPHHPFWKESRFWPAPPGQGETS